MKRRSTMLKKPQLTAEKVLDFAEAKTSRRSNLAPAGDTRLTVNLREDLHLKLRMKALEERTTAGELLERLIEKYL